jgi:hypothetical protein
MRSFILLVDPGDICPPHPLGRFAQRPSQLWIFVKNPWLLFNVSLTVTKTPPHFYPFSV